MKKTAILIYDQFCNFEIAPALEMLAMSEMPQPVKEHQLMRLHKLVFPHKNAEMWRKDLKMGGLPTPMLLIFSAFWQQT